MTPGENNSDKILDLLRQISINISHILSLELSGSSPLTVQQAYMLRKIKQNPRVNLTSLSNELCLTKGAMSLAINKMVEDGYVIRKENMVDRRNIDIILTGKGQRVLDSTIECIRKTFASLTSSLTDEELNEIKLNLEKLNFSMRKATGEKGRA
jgi:DNA-binding MarR family transcriptional regulator